MPKKTQRPRSPYAQSIENARNLRKLSQKGLAEALGVARNTVSDWESGKREPLGQNLTTLREFFGDDLLPPTPALTDMDLGYIRGRAEQIARSLENVLRDQRDFVREMQPTPTGKDDPATLSAKSKRTATQHAAKPAHRQRS